MEINEKELIDFYFENLDKNKFGLEPEIVEEGILSWLGGKLGSVWGEFSKGFKEGAGATEKIESAIERIGDSSPPGMKKLKAFLSDKDIANMPAAKLGEAIGTFMKSLPPEEQKQVVEGLSGKKIEGDSGEDKKSTSDKLGTEEKMSVVKGTKEKLGPILTQVKNGAMRGVANNTIQLVIAAARKATTKEEFMKVLSNKLFKNASETKKAIENKAAENKQPSNIGSATADQLAEFDKAK